MKIKGVKSETIFVIMLLGVTITCGASWVIGLLFGG